MPNTHQRNELRVQPVRRGKAVWPVPRAPVRRVQRDSREYGPVPESYCCSRYRHSRLKVTAASFPSAGENCGFSMSLIGDDSSESDAAVTMSLLYLLFSTTFCPRLSSTKRTNDVQANLVFFMALIKYEVFNLHAGSDGIRHSTCTPWYFPTLTPHGAPAPALREEFQSQLSPDFAVTMSAAARKHIDLMLSKHGRST